MELNKQHTLAAASTGVNFDGSHRSQSPRKSRAWPSLLRSSGSRPHPSPCACPDCHPPLRTNEHPMGTCGSLDNLAHSDFEREGLAFLDRGVKDSAVRRQSAGIMHLEAVPSATFVAVWLSRARRRGPMHASNAVGCSHRLGYVCPSPGMTVVTLTPWVQAIQWINALPSTGARPDAACQMNVECQMDQCERGGHEYHVLVCRPFRSSHRWPRLCAPPLRCKGRERGALWTSRPRQALSHRSRSACITAPGQE